mmetsp:Transcript_5484/g.13525  ORF Transcript_5484/g.13525 Transcript_5484/m.13525 type:complete len:314 (+) Transcript_5484:151-1092(+)
MLISSTESNTSLTNHFSNLLEGAIQAGKIAAGVDEDALVGGQANVSQSRFHVILKLDTNDDEVGRSRRRCDAVPCLLHAVLHTAGIFSIRKRYDPLLVPGWGVLESFHALHERIPESSSPARVLAIGVKHHAQPRPPSLGDLLERDRRLRCVRKQNEAYVILVLDVLVEDFQEVLPGLVHPTLAHAVALVDAEHDRLLLAGHGAPLLQDGLALSFRTSHLLFEDLGNPLVRGGEGRDRPPELPAEPREARHQLLIDLGHQGGEVILHAIQGDEGHNILTLLLRPSHEAQQPLCPGQHEPVDFGPLLRCFEHVL